MSDIANFSKWYKKAKQGYQYSEREIAAAAWVTALETVKPFIRAFDAWVEVDTFLHVEELDAMYEARDAIDDPDTSAVVRE